MPKGFWYWLIVVLWIIAWFLRYRYVPVEQRVWPWYAGSVVELVLFVIIGYTLFNDPLSALVK